MTCAAETQAVAGVTSQLPPTASAPAQPPAPPQSSRASLRLDIAQRKAWVGQAVAISVTAYFRDVDGVTLEGAPQIASSGLFTSELSPEPRQATQVIHGEPVLVVTWTGTLTPVSPASLEVSAQLPVHLRYHVASARVETATPFDGDPFDALRGDPFDPSFMNRFFGQALRREALVERHEQEVSLRASGRQVDVLALPAADQPASFTGAIGRFDVSASVSAPKVAISEPVTLRVVVGGEGDLDRVDVAGVASSDDWKAYPPKASLEPATKGARARKVFEQVLVPRHGGVLFVPAVSLSAFDPALSRYTTHETKPLTVMVDGPVTPISVALTGAPGAPPPTVPDVTLSATPPQTVPVTTILLRLLPLPVLVMAALLVARTRRGRAARALRRTMRANAARGEVLPFYKAARTLIERRLAERWGVNPEDVSPDAIRKHFGPSGDPLVEALVADETLRFGRGRLEGADLVDACSTIEHSLRGVS